MSQSLVKNYLHIVFSTKNRNHIIKPPYDKELHAYISQICNELECQALMVGGFTDHIHVLCMLSKKVTIVSLLQKIKSNSSKWMKNKCDSLKEFSWQDGYGCFSVNPSQIEIVKDYIKNQEEHHKKKTFKDEYIAFLKKYKVEYNENYLWN